MMVPPMRGVTWSQAMPSTFPSVFISTDMLRWVAVASLTDTAGGAGLPAAIAVDSVLAQPVIMINAAVASEYLQRFIWHRCLSRQSQIRSVRGHRALPRRRGECVARARRG